MSPCLEQHGQDVLVRIKAVPGSSRDEVAGVVGDRIKVRVSAPPEGGKANRAICSLLAQRLGVKPGRVAVESGASSPQKVVRVAGVRAEEVALVLGGGEGRG